MYLSRNKSVSLALLLLELEMKSVCGYLLSLQRGGQALFQPCGRDWVLEGQPMQALKSVPES
jgi:hypothetical protein